MPIVTTDEGTVVRFGSGDVVVRGVLEGTGEGVVSLANGRPGAVGREITSAERDARIAATMRFTNVGSLDALIEMLNKLRSVMAC